MSNQTDSHGAACSTHRQTIPDDSPRGDAYLDDRTELAYVYDGLSLRAICFDAREVGRYQETALTVRLTPAGECRIAGRCRTHNPSGGAAP